MAVCSSSFFLLLTPRAYLLLLHIAPFYLPIAPFLSSSSPSPICFSLHQFASSPSLPLDMLPVLSVNPHYPPRFSISLSPFHLAFFLSTAAHRSPFPIPSLSVSYTIPCKSSSSLPAHPSFFFPLPFSLRVWERRERSVWLWLHWDSVCVFRSVILSDRDRVER